MIAIPSTNDDKLRLGKVGLLAALGLAAGILWPRLVGLQLTPAPPSEASAAATSVPAGSAQARPSATTAAAGEPTNPVARDDQSSVKPPRVTLAQVVSCRSKEGDRETRCDTPALDPIIQSPLQALIACDAAQGVRGLLSLGFDVDFEANRLDHFSVGKSTTLPAATARQLLRCGEKELSRVSLDGVTHTKSVYRLFYKIEFAGQPTDSARTDSDSPTPSSGVSAETISASGRVTVTWDAALLRAKPKDGEVLARVLGGTRLTVTGRQGDWYRVKYDAKGSEGWVYKAAIGL